MVPDGLKLERRELREGSVGRIAVVRSGGMMSLDPWCARTYRASAGFYRNCQVYPSCGDTMSRSIGADGEEVV